MNKYFFHFLIFWSYLILSTGCVSNLSIFEEFNSDLSEWKEKIFDGRTEYLLIDAESETIIKAASNNSASALYKLVDIDLDKTPFLNWSWRVENILGELDEKTKSGDDYPARVYIIVSPSLTDIEPRSINYVWSNTSEINSFWTSAYTDNVILVAVRSGDAQTGLWLSEKRNVRADLKKAFGEDISSLIGFAIMTDTDNSGTSTVSYYGKIYFSEK